MHTRQAELAGNARRKELHVAVHNIAADIGKKLAQRLYFQWEVTVSLSGTDNNGCLGWSVQDAKANVRQQLSHSPRKCGGYSFASTCQQANCLARRHQVWLIQKKLELGRCHQRDYRDLVLCNT